MANKKNKSFKEIQRDIQNGAWNNLALGKGSKQALSNTGLILAFGLFTALSIYNKK
jgi:hypothetical protein